MTTYFWDTTAQTPDRSFLVSGIVQNSSIHEAYRTAQRAAGDQIIKAGLVLRGTIAFTAFNKVS